MKWKNAIVIVIVIIIIFIGIQFFIRLFISCDATKTYFYKVSEISEGDVDNAIKNLVLQKPISSYNCTYINFNEISENEFYDYVTPQTWSIPLTENYNFIFYRLDFTCNNTSAALYLAKKDSNLYWFRSIFPAACVSPYVYIYDSYTEQDLDRWHFQDYFLRPLEVKIR